MITTARRMGFCAGPQNETFYACQEHAHYLESGDVSNFLPLKNEPAWTVTEDEGDEEDCFFCREGGDD